MPSCSMIRKNILLLAVFFVFIFESHGQKTIPTLFVPTHEKQVKSELLQGLEKRFLSTCDEIAELPPPPRQQIGRRLLEVSRTYLKRITYLAYAYQLTGDEKYLQASEKYLLVAAEFSDWNPSHFLDVAEMTMAMGLGYDWTKDDLSPESAHKIREAIVEKGLKPSIDEKINWWINTTNNWNQVCHASMAVGAWAVESENPEFSKMIIDRAKEKIRIPEAQYDPDGAYPEGTSYWEYGTSFNVLFVDAYQKKYPVNILETSNGLMKTGEYFLHAHGPAGSFNYSDSRQNEVISAAMFWFASKSKDLSLIYNQVPLVQKIVTGENSLDAETSEGRFYAFLLIWFSELENVSAVAPEVTSWFGGGENPVSFLRSGWRRDDIYLGNKAGSPSISHGHMDIGSFVMDAAGVRWAIDLGMNNYNDLETSGVNIWDKSPNGDRWKVFRYNNFSHNTLVVDSSFQDVDSEAKILKVIDRKKLKSSKMDISSAYKTSLISVLRTSEIIKNKEVVIRDEIKNNGQRSNVRWGMMTYDDIELVDNSTAIISHDGKRLGFKIVSPKNSKLKIYPATPMMPGEEANEGRAMIGFETELQPNESAKLEVIMNVILIDLKDIH